MSTVHFVVLTHGRTGSTLLWRALDGHPEARMYGEVFHRLEEHRRLYFQVAGRFYRDGDYAADFLARVVYGDRPQAPAALGFKLFYDQARGDLRAETAWDYLLIRRDVRVIHLERWNLLEALISERVAALCDQWDLDPVAAAEPREVAPFPIDPEYCQRYFETIHAHRVWAARAFARHASIRIEYERDLCARFAATMARVCAFLSLAPHRPEPSLVKQARKRPWQQVSNYRSLRDHFHSTPFSAYFAEERESAA